MHQVAPLALLACLAGCAASGTYRAAIGPPDGVWLVRYVADRVQLTDHWFYDSGRWVFDLPLSNPGSVSLYKLPGKQYIAQLGRSH
jgi:hypothetical protein